MTSQGSIPAEASTPKALLLDSEPADCLFVDDDPELPAAALALGHQGRAMLREGGAAANGVPAIGSLTESLDLV